VCDGRSTNCEGLPGEDRPIDAGIGCGGLESASGTWTTRRSGTQLDQMGQGEIERMKQYGRRIRGTETYAEAQLNAEIVEVTTIAGTSRTWSAS